MIDLAHHQIESTELHKEPPVWQDSWPSLSYAIDFNHKKHRQVNPQVLRELMLELGIPEGEVPKLSMVIGNTHERGISGYYNNADDGDGDHYGNEGPTVVVSPQNKIRETASTTIHELSHYKDDLDGSIGTYEEHAIRKRIGVVLGIGVAAALQTVYVKNGLYDQLNTDSLMGGISGGASAWSFGNIGRLIGYRTIPTERRAFRAARNKEMLKRYSSKLFTEPEPDTLERINQQAPDDSTMRTDAVRVLKKDILEDVVEIEDFSEKLF